MSAIGENPATTGRVASGPRAGFWQRFAAAFIDGVILLVVAFVIDVVALPKNSAVGEAISILIALAYFTYFEGGPRGQTLGKRAMQIRVIDFNTGESIGYGRAAIRYVGSILSGIVIYIGYLWMLWDREKQTWHDKLSGAVVVPALMYPVQ